MADPASSTLRPRRRRISHSWRPRRRGVLSKFRSFHRASGLEREEHVCVVIPVLVCRALESQD
eukprot:2148453-Lingulodinium_polyedra.AAC.1